MAITFVSAGAGGVGAAAVTVGMPAGATTDDILILVIEGNGEDVNADAPPTGGAWTLIGSAASATVYAGATTRCSAYWALYDAAINLTVPDAGNHTTAQVWAFRGVDTTIPMDVDATSGANATSSASHSAVTGQTSSTANAVALLAVGIGDYEAVYNATPITNGNLTNRAGIGFTRCIYGSKGSVGMLYGEREAAGAIGTWGWAASTPTQDAWVSMVLRDASAVVAGGGLMLMGVG